MKTATNQMFSLTHYPKDSSKKEGWIDPAMTAKDNISHIGQGQIAVEPGLMFDELNQTSPAFSNKASHQPKVMKPIGSYSPGKKNATQVGFNKKNTITDLSNVTGVDFYKEVLIHE